MAGEQAVLPDSTLVLLDGGHPGPLVDSECVGLRLHLERAHLPARLLRSERLFDNDAPLVVHRRAHRRGIKV